MAQRQMAVRERSCARPATPMAPAGRAPWPSSHSPRAAGRLRRALAQLNQAQATIEGVLTASRRNQMLERGLAEVRSRKVPVLLALGRLDDASREADAVFALLQPLVASDPLNIQYRADLAYAWLRLGDARLRRVASARPWSCIEGRSPSGESARRVLRLHLRALGADAQSQRVAEPLLDISPPRLDEARAHFSEAQAVGLAALERAPSYTQVRRQVTLAEEALAGGAARPPRP